MKNMKINYFLVGCFVISMILAGLISIATLTGRTGATSPYVAYYNNVTGVQFGTQVLYEGYVIGQVEDITPEPSTAGMRFRVDLSVQEGWKIPEDSIAQIAAPGLLSALTIAISAGSSPVALEPGSEIPAREQANIFATLSDVAGEITELSNSSLKPLLANINRSAEVIGDAMEKDGVAIFDQVRALMDRAPAIAANVEVASEQLVDASNELTLLFSQANREELEEIIGDTSLLLADLQSTQRTLDNFATNLDALIENNGDDVEETVEDIRFIADSVSRHIESINQNLEGTTRNFLEFSRKIRGNPGLLLGGSAPQDAAQ